MAFAKDYYSILNLPSTSTPQFSTADLRRAYKLALLVAHPDKQAFANPSTATTRRSQSVDDVKEAYNVLSDAGKRREYENYVLRNPGVLRRGGLSGGGGDDDQDIQLSSDFVLGLEGLDLSDFDVLDPEWDVSEMPPGGSASASGMSTPKESGGDVGAGAEEKQMEWTRGCRCGAEQGFRILEEELEDAERRGEKEVLVGCEGCSLWVRVGFDVEEA